MEESDCNQEDFVAVRLNEICRSCLLKTGENMTNLCEKTDNAAVLITMLSSIGNVEIEINELLPSYLCAPCEDKLKSCYEFQQQLHRSEEIIRQCFIEDKIDVKDDELVDLIDIEETLVVFEPEEKAEIKKVEIKKDEIKKDEKPEVTIERIVNDKKKTRLSRFPYLDVQVAIEEAKGKLDEQFLQNVTCIVCRFESSNSRALSAHMTFLHKEVKEKWCSICNSVEGDLPKHMKDLHNHTQHKCKFCGRCMKSRSHFIEHLRGHGNIRPFLCTFCNKSFISSSRLICHKRMHTAKEFLECPHCKKTFNRLVYLQNHLKTHKDLTCSKCSKHFESAELFNAHACDNSEDVPEAPPPTDDAPSDEHATVSTTDPQNFCNKCNRRVRSLKSHVDKHHSDKKIEVVSNVATCLCAVCGKQCRSNAKLKIHMRVHTGELPYKCAHCDRRMSSRHQLVVHERTHTGEKPHACGICGRAFAQSSVLNTHMKIHTGRPEQCDICKKRFCRPAQLKLHLRKHTGEKPYACSVCGQGFRQKSHLVDHERTHSDDRPFTCNYCYKGFKQKTTLRSHLQIHMDKRPFKCSQCPYACRQSHSLTMHMKQHEADAPRDDKPHLCVICQRGFNTIAMLTSHVGQVHPSMRMEIGTIQFPVLW